jgi:hypothetical protein
MELRPLPLRHEARVAALDWDVVNLEEIPNLARTFDDLTIVCAHHSSHQHKSMTALNAGAMEFCHPRNIRSILRASRAAAKRFMAIVL